jgi:hypothetical protein
MLQKHATHEQKNHLKTRWQALITGSTKWLICLRIINIGSGGYLAMAICEDRRDWLAGTVSANEDVHNEHTRIIIRSSAAQKLNRGDLITITLGDSHRLNIDRNLPHHEVVWKFATARLLASVVRTQQSEYKMCHTIEVELKSRERTHYLGGK